jgi:hypothetical protein
VRFALLLSLAALGCASEPTPPSQTAVAVPLPPASSETHREDAGASAPSVESLALLAGELAPGMRELARGESPLPATLRIEATPSNACLRAVVAGDTPVVAALVSDTSKVLDVSEAAKTTVLGSRGPVCLKKAEGAHVEVQGPAGSVRYVVWVLP